MIPINYKIKNKILYGIKKRKIEFSRKIFGDEIYIQDLKYHLKFTFENYKFYFCKVKTTNNLHYGGLGSFYLLKDFDKKLEINKFIFNSIKSIVKINEIDSVNLDKNIVYKYGWK
jgi:hypothetical protein